MSNMPDLPSRTAPIQSLDRGLQLLMAVSESPQPVSLRDLAGVIDIDRSSIYRLVNTLKLRGFLKQSYEDKTYSLGPSLWRLTNQMRQRSSLLHVAHAHIDLIVKAIDETAHLAIRDGTKVVVIDHKQTEQVLGISTRLGGTEPLAITALGRALLADYDLEKLTYLFGDDKSKWDKSDHIDSLDKLAIICERTCRCGFAVDDEEYRDKIRCVAAPIRDYDRQVVGAIGISAPSDRLPKRDLGRIGRKLCREANDISAKLGYVVPE